MPRRDLWKECFAGEHQQHLSPEDFKRLFCRLCRNPECVNSASGRSKWANRIETQVDRLLDNPIFADLNDPKFAAIHGLDFKDAMRQAIALEITTQKGDWEIPTEAEAETFAAQMTAQMPGGFQAPEPEPEPEDDEPEVEILWEGEAKGSKKGTSYKVTLARVGDSEPAWSCTCPATQYGTAPPGGCKHVVAAMAQMEADAEAEVEVTEEPEPEPEAPSEPEQERPQGVDPETWKQMRERNRVPRSPNTQIPEGGIMIGGASPPEPEDPWAVDTPPPPTGEVVPVGGKIVMGGGAPPKKSPK